MSAHQTLRWAIVILAALVWHASAAQGKREDWVLHFDEPVQVQKFSFEYRHKLEAEPSSFVFVNYAFMSNEVGERWALATFRNTSNTTRLLKNEHVVATFANGARRHPLNLDERLDGGQIFTKTINFGFSDFPIIGIEMR